MTRPPAQPPGESGRGGPGGHRHQLDLGARTAGRAAAGAPVRLGADPAGRRGHGHAARGGRRVGREPCRPGCGSAPRWAATRSATSTTSPASNPATPAMQRTAPAPTQAAGGRSTMITTPIAAALRAHRLRRGEPLPARAGRGPAARAALPGLRQGLHPAARRLPGRRGAHRRRGGIARHRHRDHVLHSQRALPGPARSRRRTSRPRCCSTGPTSRSSTSSWAARRTRCGWGCGWRRSGSRATGVGHHSGEHRPLPAHRRAGRTVRVLRPPSVKDRNRD